jgi:transcriptional regulator with PAS, ATPase and Fis domain
MEKYADIDTTVLILGESGTGKNLIAEYIHRHSKRKDQRFIEINCSAIPENLLETEMFGVIAQYPGFHNQNPLKGKFELCQKGTLFLNEIGDLPLRLQPKLLEAIESKKIWPLGATEPVSVDIRIVVATHHNLERDVREGLFRRDLFERLNIISIRVPPLRERKEDIMILAGYFLFKLRQEYGKKINRFSVDCMEFLNAYEWPGNIRELRSAIERAVVNSGTPILTHESFSLQGHAEKKPVSLKEVEKAHIIKVLEYTNGNKEKACKILEISKQTLYNKGKEYNLPNFLSEDQTV